MDYSLGVRIALVPSASGLGHARRLLSLLPCWGNDHQFLFFCTERQNTLLQSQVRQLELKGFQIILVIYSPQGLQGPTSFDVYPYERTKQNRRFKRAIEVLNSAELVLSDNSLWPLRYRDDTAVLAHFSWIDFHYQSSNKQIQEIVQIEIELIEKCNNLNLIFPFAFGFLRQASTFKRIDLWRINHGVNDFKLKQDKISLAIGTKFGRDACVERKFRGLFENLAREETYEMILKGEIPRYCIARPGLSTIQDLMSLEIPFITVLFENDIELENNNKVLNNMEFKELDFVNLNFGKLRPRVYSVESLGSGPSLNSIHQRRPLI